MESLTRRVYETDVEGGTRKGRSSYNGWDAVKNTCNKKSIKLSDAWVK